MLISLAFWLKEAVVERVLLIVLIVEILNSAIESVVGRIGDEHHVLSDGAKDMGSAAVCISLLLVCVTWIIILI